MNKSGPILRPRLYKIAHNARSSRRARDEVMSKELGSAYLLAQAGAPKERHLRADKRLSQAAGTKDRPKENPAMGRVWWSRPRLRSQCHQGPPGQRSVPKDEGVADPICPTTPWITGRARGCGGKWATGCFPNASSAHWFLRLVDRKKAPTEPGLLEGRGSRRC